MKPAAIRFTRCLAGAAIALACALPARASLVFSFALDADQTGANENVANPANFGFGLYNPSGGNVILVPASGSTYYIDVVVTSDNAAVSRIGFQAGYYGAISTLLAGTNSLQGGVRPNTWSTATSSGNISTDLNNNDYWGFTQGGDNADIGRSPGQTGAGTIQDNNSDGRLDLGGTTGERVNVGSPDAMPWWVRPISGANPVYANTSNSIFSAAYKGRTGSLVSTAQEVIGYFVVNIPAYDGSSGPGGDSLAYTPALGPSSIANTYTWGDVSGGVTTLRNGNLSTQAGDNNVLAGDGITFERIVFIPEPGSLALIGLGGAGLFFGSRGVRHTRRYALSQCPAR